MPKKAKDISSIKVITQEERVAAMAEHLTKAFEALGLDLAHPSIKDTPNRVAKMYVNELCSGMFLEPPKVTVFPNEGYDQMLVERNISFISLCEHHFAPIIGKAHIAYLPKKVVVGLSKFHRVVQHFAARPQLQERLGCQIVDYFKKVLDTEDIALVIEAEHYCCKIRGPKDPNSTTITSHIHGVFKSPEVRAEAMALLGITK